MWFKRKIVEPWTYLGFTEIRYVDDQSKPTSKCAMQFYARGPGYLERKCEYPGWSKFEAEHHGYWQKSIIPWINGNNLYAPIHDPSDNLKRIAKDTFGYEFVDKRWVKPAPKYEKSENVVRFPSAAS